MLSKSEQWWCTEYTEYADEIHAILRKREYDRIGFDGKAPQIKWRMHLLQYIMDVARKHELTRETVHLAIYIMDIFMDNNMIRLWRLYLVALTSIRIAAKFIEKDFTSPQVEALSASVNYSKQDFNILESIMLKMFDWDINIPTASTFCEYYADFVVDETDFDNNQALYDCFEDFKLHMKSQAMDFLDLALFDLSMQHDVQPSKLAAMCLAAARYHEFRHLKPVWPNRLMKLTEYKWECIKSDIVKLFSIKLIPRDQLKAELDEKINQESDLEFD
ncbi:cyclin-J [Sitodiplosis mosellana]|uniref:cyclin-J n=1 Tax=Sitodiplosis mosellana TaxID=263140 RepID=UPI00244430C4|nr:cyclin-J [Sitodiplosis mosellana]